MSVYNIGKVPRKIKTFVHLINALYYALLYPRSRFSRNCTYHLSNLSYIKLFYWNFATELFFIKKKKKLHQFIPSMCKQMHSFQPKFILQLAVKKLFDELWMEYIVLKIQKTIKKCNFFTFQKEWIKSIGRFIFNAIFKY